MRTFRACNKNPSGDSTVPFDGGQESSRPVIIAFTRVASAVIHIGARDFWRNSADSVHVSRPL